MNSGPNGDRPYRDHSEGELFEQIRICEQNRTRASREASNLQRIGDDDYKGFSALERSLSVEIRQIDDELAMRRIERGEIRKGSSAAVKNSSRPTTPDDSVKSPDDYVKSSEEALFHGPCLIIDRNTGLALDATQGAVRGTNPLLWTPHAPPWQQWRLQRIGGPRLPSGLVRIVSEPTKLVLTKMERPHDWSPVWLEEQGGQAQQWRLMKTEDGAAFVIEHAGSRHSLDTGAHGKNGDKPHLWSTHWESWQQWMICRLPLT
jgi:hypothetical protein